MAAPIVPATTETPSTDESYHQATFDEEETPSYHGSTFDEEPSFTEEGGGYHGATFGEE